MALVLDAKKRTHFQKQNRSLRSEGSIPAVVYGKVKENLHIQLDEGEFRKIYQKAGESTLVDLRLEKEQPIKVIIQDMQWDPVKHNPLHVDFLAIDMNKKLTAEADLQFVGESKAVKELGGILVKNHDSLGIECLPGDLVHEIEVNLSLLATFDDRVTIGDLKLPQGVVCTENPEEVVVFVEEPRSEKELEELDTQVDTEVKDVEVEEKGKQEEEGEEATAGEEQKKEEPKEEKK